jgi:hypothetical protein
MDQDQIKKIGADYLEQASKFCRTECDNSSVLPSAIHKRTFLYANLSRQCTLSFDKNDIKKMNDIKPYSNDSDTRNWITGRNLVKVPFCFHHSVNAVRGNNRCLIYKY